MWVFDGSKIIEKNYKSWLQTSDADGNHFDPHPRTE